MSTFQTNESGLNELFNILEKVVKSVDSCPYQSVLKNLLDICSKCIRNFNKDLRILMLDADEISLDVFCAVANSLDEFTSGLRGLYKLAVDTFLVKDEDVYTVR